MQFWRSRERQVVRIKRGRDWKTGPGPGLRMFDTEERLLQLCGKPGSVSPSTQNGQPLELWYYVFDWADPDVPQVMEVVCERDV